MLEPRALFVCFSDSICPPSLNHYTPIGSGPVQDVDSRGLKLEFCLQPPSMYSNLPVSLHRLAFLCCPSVQACSQFPKTPCTLRRFYRYVCAKNSAYKLPLLQPQCESLSAFTLVRCSCRTIHCSSTAPEVNGRRFQIARTASSVKGV